MPGRGGSAPNRAGGLATRHAAPEFLLRRQKQMLVEGIGGYLDLDPFAATGDDREHRASGIGDPHIVLDLGRVLLGRGLLRERPGQHEFGLEDRPAARDNPVNGRPHPAEHGMPEPMLNAFDGLPGVALVPMPIERFSHQAELDDEVAGQVLRLGFAPFLLPEADEGGFIIAHDDPSVGAADEGAATFAWFGPCD
jgi:hypothetical protein